MYRLNVGASQLQECVKQGMFALSGKPSINVGEALLLQLKKGDWQAEKSNEGRIIGAASRRDRDDLLRADDTTIVEKFSVDRAVIELGSLFPGARIEIQAHNNPGFDLVAIERGQVVRYVEVKGTRAGEPIFHLTETERRFSAENASQYTLLVIWTIDLARGTYRLTRHDGEVAVDSILRPERYLGRLSLSAGVEA